MEEAANLINLEVDVQIEVGTWSGYGSKAIGLTVGLALWV
jgi:hypothetical protein